MPEPSLPVGNVTFMFSDIEGSTRLLRTVGRDTYRLLLEEHNRCFRDALGDAVVSTEGDSFFCVFPTAGAAVAGAVTVQATLRNHDWPSEVDVRVRMGLHSGEGVLGGDNYVGLDVHRAARIASAAHGGQVLLSDATRAQATGSLPEGVAWRDLGEHRLKDLADTEHIFQLTIAEARNDFPPLNSLETAPTNLPEHLSTFVGRADELRDIAASLEASRLVTLTGPGGSGKTRLAIEAGQATRAGYSGGVFFAGLASISDAELVGARIAAELSIAEQVGRSAEATLIDYLRPRRTLLIVDNCEHLADTVAGLVQSLLLACPDLAVLATSREPLLIDGERSFEVGPMRLDTTSPETTAGSDAMLLFSERAVAASPGFDTDRWLTECVEICRRLDGIPLAIELAAARVAMLTPAEIVSRLDDRFELLVSRSRTAVPRQKTLEATIDWSYDLLNDGAQRLLRSLAIFRGGFTLEAANAVCFDGETAEGVLLDQLSELREKSLLQRTPTFTGTRFGLIETIRQYADARVRREAEYEELEQRHRRYYTELAASQSHRLAGAEQLDALAAIEADHDNFRAVVRRRMSADDSEAAADMTRALVWFWYLHAHFTEGEEWTQELLEQLPDEPTGPWLGLLLGSALYDFRTGNYNRSAARAEAALRAATNQDLTRIQLWAHAYLATNEMYRLGIDAARQHAQQAVRLSQKVADIGGLGYAMFQEVGIDAWTLFAESRLAGPEATQLLERIDPLADGADALGDRNMIGHIRQLEGQIASAGGATERAGAAFDRAITALSELGTVACACHCLDAIAVHIAGQGDHGTAVQLVGAGRRLRTDIGIIVSPMEAPWQNDALDRARSNLSAGELEAALDRGARLGLAEATQLARAALAQD
jgi:predicted ATPase/class 3 adenylate cyclase